MKKQIFSILTAAALAAGSVPVSLSSEAVTTTCTEYSGSNVEAQNYDRWTSPIGSYLTKTSDGKLMRVQSADSVDGILVEYYDTDYNILSTKIVAAELPIFGGFYETDSNYFIVSGQSNTDESADVEVYRITKYDKSWNRLGSAGLYDCNTTVPFDAGTVRMDTCGKYLLIHTSHEMYETSDGYNHQANVTIELDMDSMEITDSLTSIANNQVGYVSHSFNQFIKVDESNHIISVNHGDAYPRSIVLLEYATDVSTGSFKPDYFNSPCTAVDVLEIPGEEGENVTGATVGGFEISSSSYLIAGNSVIQDDSNISRTTRNVFVASVDKSTNAVTFNQITNYSEGDGTTRTPQFVELATDEYMLLWSRDNTVYYTEIDDEGNQNGDIYTVEGALSDCVPLVSDDKLIWYTWEDGDITFYDISVSDPSQVNVTEIENGHNYVIESVSDGTAKLVCTKCGDVQEKAVATSINVWWNDNGGLSYSSAFNRSRAVGDKLYYWITYTPSGVDGQMEVISSDPKVAAVTPTSDDMGYITFLKQGEVTLTARPKLNPELAKTWTVTSTLSLQSASLRIENDMTAVFYLPADKASAYTDISAEIVQDKADGTSETQMVKGVLNGDYYEFAYTGVNAKEVGDKLHATVCATDIDTYETIRSATLDYSVKDYCMALLDKTDDELSTLGYTTEESRASVRQLLADLLNYSAAAQNYFDYATSALANAAMSETQKGWATSDSAVVSISNVTDTQYKTIDEPSAEWYSAGLNLLNKTNIRLLFKYDGDISDVTLTAELDGNRTEITDFIDAGNGCYYAFYDGVSAYQFAEPVDFTLSANGTAISNTLRYSVESYISNMYDEMEDSEILTALLKYGRSAAAYKNG